MKQPYLKRTTRRLDRFVGKAEGKMIKGGRLRSYIWMLYA